MYCVPAAGKQEFDEGLRGTFNTTFSSAAIGKMFTQYV